MRRSLAALSTTAVVVGSLVATAAAGAAPSGASARSAAGTAAVTPRISFRQDPKKPGYYVVTVTPASRLRTSLVSYSMCNFAGQNCVDPEVIDVEYLPKAARHSVSWGMADFWQQPDGDSKGQLYPGTYKVVMAIPGTKVSTETVYKISPSGGD